MITKKVPKRSRVSECACVWQRIYIPFPSSHVSADLCESVCVRLRLYTHLLYTHECINCKYAVRFYYLRRHTLILISFSGKADCQGIVRSSNQLILHRRVTCVARRITSQHHQTHRVPFTFTAALLLLWWFQFSTRRSVFNVTNCVVYPLVTGYILQRQKITLFFHVLLSHNVTKLKFKIIDNKRGREKFDDQIKKNNCALKRSNRKKKPESCVHAFHVRNIE